MSDSRAMPYFACPERSRQRGTDLLSVVAESRGDFHGIVTTGALCCLLTEAAHESGREEPLGQER
jgi:hypothetical protein